MTHIERPSTAVTVTAVLVALACLGFAAVNVGYAFTDHFVESRYPQYAAGLAVVNWLVVPLKVAGAAVALLSVVRRRIVPPAAMTVLLWSAFTTLGVYAAGSVVEAVGFVTGLTGSIADVDLAGVAYVLFFTVFATGFGVLAVSHSRRHGARKLFVALGMLGAPVLLGTILLAAPLVLTAAGLMPAV